MPPNSIRMAIADSLDNLSRDDMEKFCYQLIHREGEPRVRRNKLEDKSRAQVTDVLVNTFTETDALKVTLEILRRIGCSQDAQELDETTRSLTSFTPNSNSSAVGASGGAARGPASAADLPETWAAMPPGTFCTTITIAAGTPEHTEIHNLFQATCNRTVTKIKRIQNPILWLSYQIKKQYMDEKNSDLVNERRLFHGTCRSNTDYISRHGFNRSYAGRNASMYGRGTYFAVNASYSASDCYSRPTSEGKKYIYLCRVLVGKFTHGKAGLITAPPITDGSTDMYDSVVDNTHNPATFVIFQDSQSYPEYLITCK